METTFIYALCDPRTFEVRYIGKANNPYKRYCQHLIDNKKSYKTNWIKQLLKEGFIPIQQILEECNRNEWEEKEINWIDFYKNKIGCNLTNITEGGEGKRGNVSLETRLKLRIAATGRHLSLEARKKLSVFHIGKHHTKETRNKLREIQKGKLSPMQGKHHSHESKLKISKHSAMRGKHLTEKQKIILSEANKGNKWNMGKHLSEETKKKLSDANKGKPSWNKGKSSWAKGKHLSEETKRKISETKKINRQVA